MRFEVVVQGMTIVQAVDGDAGWTVQPMTGKKDAERMSADDLKEAQDQADIDGPLVDYKKKGHKVELAGKEKIEGTDAYKFKVTKKNGDIEYVYLDADAFLEIKTEGKRVIRGTPVEFESTSGDYKEVSDVMFPFSAEFGNKAEKVKRAPYLLSGVLVCSACGAPMSMNGGSHGRYYREVCAQVADLDARLAQDPEAGREQLRRWLKDGSIRIGPRKDGAVVAEGDLLPLVVISDGGGRKGNYAKPSSMVSRSSIGVAGA